MKFARQLSDAAILTIFHAQGTHIEIGLDHEVSPAHVGAIKAGRYHSEITGAVFQGKRRRARRRRACLSSMHNLKIIVDT